MEVIERTIYGSSMYIEDFTSSPTLVTSAVELFNSDLRGSYVINKISVQPLFYNSVSAAEDGVTGYYNDLSFSLFTMAEDRVPIMPVSSVVLSLDDRVPISTQTYLETSYPIPLYFRDGLYIRLWKIAEEGTPSVRIPTSETAPSAEFSTQPMVRVRVEYERVRASVLPVKKSLLPAWDTMYSTSADAVVNLFDATVSGLLATYSISSVSPDTVFTITNPRVIIPYPFDTVTASHSETTFDLRVVRYGQPGVFRWVSRFLPLKSSSSSNRELDLDTFDIYPGEILQLHAYTISTHEGEDGGVCRSLKQAPAFLAQAYVS
jgi:hypothetical protein